MLYAKISESIFKAEDGTLVNFHTSIPSKAANPSSEFFLKHGHANWVELDLSSIPEIRVPVKTYVDERTLALYDEATNARRTYIFPVRKYVRRGNVYVDTHLTWKLNPRDLSYSNMEAYYSCCIKRHGVFVFEHNNAKLAFQLVGISYFDTVRRDYRVIRKTDDIFNTMVVQQNHLFVPFELGIFAIEATAHGIEVSVTFNEKLRLNIPTKFADENAFGMIFKVLLAPSITNTKQESTDKVQVLQENVLACCLGDSEIGNFKVTVGDNETNHSMTQYVTASRGANFLSFVTSSDLLASQENIKLAFGLYTPLNLKR